MEDKKRWSAGTIVQHYKRNNLTDEALKESPFMYLYKIIGYGIHTETEEDLVIYEACYGSRKWWVRPASMFYGKINEHSDIDRFSKYSEPAASEDTLNKFVLKTFDHHYCDDIYCKELGLYFRRNRDGFVCARVDRRDAVQLAEKAEIDKVCWYDAIHTMDTCYIGPVEEAYMYAEGRTPYDAFVKLERKCSLMSRIPLVAPFVAWSNEKWYCAGLYLQSGDAYGF